MFMDCKIFLKNQCITGLFMVKSSEAVHLQ